MEGINSPNILVCGSDSGIRNPVDGGPQQKKEEEASETWELNIKDIRSRKFGGEYFKNPRVLTTVNESKWAEVKRSSHSTLHTPEARRLPSPPSECLSLLWPPHLISSVKAPATIRCKNNKFEEIK